ncbi:hypothetical protein RRG08_047411 [Elysia crispata]|uniref:Uncharacterized protein n=1 Tax=Elysia crispata TaxID=231223 RepID=A0AAE0YUE1_9GAST|nr:hypothetical protein RRG08_047411 [Elysia crispata]
MTKVLKETVDESTPRAHISQPRSQPTQTLACIPLPTQSYLVAGIEYHDTPQRSKVEHPIPRNPPKDKKTPDVASILRACAAAVASSCQSPARGRPVDNLTP